MTATILKQDPHTKKIQKNFLEEWTGKEHSSTKNSPVI